MVVSLSTTHTHLQFQPLSLVSVRRCPHEDIATRYKTRSNAASSSKVRSAFHRRRSPGVIPRKGAMTGGEESVRLCLNVSLQPGSPLPSPTTALHHALTCFFILWKSHSTSVQPPTALFLTHVSHICLSDVYAPNPKRTLFVTLYITTVSPSVFRAHEPKPSGLLLVLIVELQ